jgi:chemotaxis protein CheD
MGEMNLGLLEFEIGMGLIMTVQNPSILSISGMGSCVGLALRDGVSGISGLAHVVLPDSTDADDACSSPGKYSDTAVRVLSRRMLLMGADFIHITAKLVGGASGLSNGGFDGWRNVESARRELSKANITVVAQDVGLNLGRSMSFDTASGDITIRRYQRIDDVAELKDIIVI